MSTMFCLAGVPGVGKTTWAEHFLKDHSDFLYFSPDQYYERINGDECNRANTFDVWMTMFCDIHAAELAGCNILIDSDNLTYAQRNQWIEWFPGFDKKVLLFIEEDYETCLDRVSKRRRTIPEEIMCEKMIKWENPFDCSDPVDWDEVCQIKKEGDYYVYEGL